jgi:hypothetical protein
LRWARRGNIRLGVENWILEGNIKTRGKGSSWQTGESYAESAGTETDGEGTDSGSEDVMAGITDHIVDEVWDT